MNTKVMFLPVLAIFILLVGGCVQPGFEKQTHLAINQGTNTQVKAAPEPNNPLGPITNVMVLMFSGFDFDTETSAKQDSKTDLAWADKAAALVKGFQATMEGINTSLDQRKKTDILTPPGDPVIEDPAPEDPIVEDPEPENSTHVNINDTSIRWKPVSANDRKLVVLLPKSFGRQPVEIVNTGEKGKFTGDEANGGRAHYRFSKTGIAYPKNTVLKVGTKTYLVPEPGRNYNK